MPGGSVNGRPFRESTDSFQKTGIPCGNPRRYHSQDVVRMEAGQRSASRAIDGPVEEIETEGQRHLKALALQQTVTNVTVKQQLSLKRQFTRGAEHRPATDEVSGMVSLAEFQTLERTDGYIEKMKGYGLTEEEILLMLEAEQSHNIKKSKLVNPEHMQAKVEEIKRKIAEKKQSMSKPDIFSNTKHVSRHEMDLERALSTTSKKNSFLHKTLVKEQSRATAAPDDPMNNLPEILESVVPGKYNVIHPLRKNKIPKHSFNSECTLECCKPATSHVCSDCERAGLVNGQCSHELPVATCMERPKEYVPNSATCLSQVGRAQLEPAKKPSIKSSSYIVNRKHQATVTLYNDSDVIQDADNHGFDNRSHTFSEDGDSVNTNDNRSDLRVLDGDVESIPDESIRRFKLSSEEVKKLPRFENYAPGEPSNVLYVKNLSPKVTEADLASLFIHYQEDAKSRIVFKLMTGRMKGQAFVTFPDVTTASTALEMVHGYQFKGKPVIIQFGRKTDT